MFSLIINYDKTSTCYSHFFDMFELIVENTDSEFINLKELESNIDNLEQYYLDTFGSIPKYIICFCGVGGFFNLYKKIIKFSKLVFIVDDIHHAKSVRNPRIPVISNSHLILATYAYEFIRWGLPQPSKLYLYPHAARWVIDFNNNPIKKVLISGRLSDIYPDRKFVTDIGIKNPDKYDILKANMNYKDPNQNSTTIVGIKFYQYLNKYLCCFLDSAREYILAKVFEICASGSLLLYLNTEIIEEFKLLGFIDGENYISCTRDNLHEKVNWILDPNNLDQVNKIREQGYQLIKNKHTYIKRFEEILFLLEYDEMNDCSKKLIHDKNIYSINTFKYKNIYDIKTNSYYFYLI